MKKNQATEIILKRKRTWTQDQSQSENQSQEGIEENPYSFFIEKLGKMEAPWILFAEPRSQEYFQQFLYFYVTRYESNLFDKMGLSLQISPEREELEWKIFLYFPPKKREITVEIRWQPQEEAHSQVTTSIFLADTPEEATRNPRDGKTSFQQSFSCFTPICDTTNYTIRIQFDDFEMRHPIFLSLLPL